MADREETAKANAHVLAGLEQKDERNLAFLQSLGLVEQETEEGFNGGARESANEPRDLR